MPSPQLADHHLQKIRERGFSDDLIAKLASQNGHPPILQSLTAEEIQRDWLHLFPSMRGNPDGALLLRFNSTTFSLKPDKPDWDPEHHRFTKYLYAKRAADQPKGSNTQPWLPNQDPKIATEGLFDALACSALMEHPCAGATAPSHVLRSNFPDSVKVYVNDADVIYHHAPSLMPVVIGQCRKKGLRIAIFPRNPAADYAYTDDRIPEDCKWGAEEWAREWKRQGLDPKAEMQKVIDNAKDPYGFLAYAFKQYKAIGVKYPLQLPMLTNAARSIADATDRPDQRQALKDLLAAMTGAPKTWIQEGIERRDAARFQEEQKALEERIALGLEDPPTPLEPTPPDPYQIAEGRPVDVHISNLLLSGDTLYGSHQSSLFTYDHNTGFWSRMAQPVALQMVQQHVEQVFTIDRDDRRTYPYGTSQQVNSCLTALIIKAASDNIANPAPIIPFLGKAYDCNTSQPIPHSPDHGATYGIAAPLLLTDQCPDTFTNAIDTCFGAEYLPLIRAWIRAIVDPTIPYGRFLLVVGQTGSGKGMLLEFLDSLLPASCRSSLEEPGDICNQDKVYQLVLGKRYVTFHDLPARLKPMQLFYKLVENAEVSARKLNASDSSAIAANCRFSAAATKLPTLADGNDGFVRRALVLTTKPRLSKPNRSIKDAIVGNTAEHATLRAQVIGWALAMPRRDVIDTLYGDACSELLSANIDDLEANADAVAHFIDECLTTSNVEVTPANWDWIFQCFRSYCDNQGFVGKGSKFHLQGAIRAKLPHLHRKRGKEPLAVAIANGRNKESRLNLPACDWGFKLREGAFQRRLDRVPRLVSGCIGSDGLGDLRNHRPECPLFNSTDSGSDAKSTVRQNGDSPSQTPSAAVGDTVSQGSSPIDREEKEEVSTHHANTCETPCAHIPLSHKEEPGGYIPETPRHTTADLDSYVEDLPF